MTDKTKYIERVKELYRQKNNVALSDDLASEYFEDLIVLVQAINVPLKQKIYGRK